MSKLFPPSQFSGPKKRPSLCLAIHAEGDLVPVAQPSPAIANIATVDNHVYFYALVTPENCLALVRELRGAAAFLRAANFTGVPVILHIMSEGGDAFAALAIADQIPQIGWPVHAIVEGLCASAGTLIALACQQCMMQRNAFMLFHSGDAGFNGTYQQFQDYAGILDTMNDQLIDFYVAHTSAERGRIEEMLKRDTWLNATKAAELGMVNGVL